MDIYRDELRRQLRELHTEHDAAMPRWRDALMRLLVGSNDTPSPVKAETLLGGFNRRKFMRMGGGAALASAVLVACGGDDDEPGASGTTATTAGGGGGNETDITIARTAASLELFAVAVYNTAIDGADTLGITPDVGGAAMLFRDQHSQHAGAFNGAAEQLGGEPFNMANPTAQEQFASTIEGLADQADVVKFAYDLENIAAQTYQGVGAGMLSTPELRQTTMSIGGVEARHAAILAMFIDGQDPNPNAFQPTDQAAGSEFFV
ncbi:MAG: ferritin-like domain-containing protein [Acidimicrobiales bacterium]